MSLIDRADPALSIVAQCRLLKVARSTLYWRPAAASADDLAVMRQMDELYLARPFYGSRRMVAVLRRDGWMAAHSSSGSPMAACQQVLDRTERRGWRRSKLEPTVTIS